MNLFHKVYAFHIPFSTCIFTINTVRNGCAVAVYSVFSCPRVMALEMSVILTYMECFFCFAQLLPRFAEFTLFIS